VRTETVTDFMQRRDRPLLRRGGATNLYGLLVFAKARAAGASRTAHNFPLAPRPDLLRYVGSAPPVVESDLTPGVRLASRT
jgi:hypothetical protein